MPHATALQPSVPGLSPKPGVMPRRPPRRRPPLPSVSASLLPFGSRRWKALRRGCGRGCPGAQVPPEAHNHPRPGAPTHSPRGGRSMTMPDVLCRRPDRLQGVASLASCMRTARTTMSASSRSRCAASLPLHTSGMPPTDRASAVQILRSERQPVPVPIGTFPGGSETSSSRGARMAFVFALFVHVTPSILRAMSCVRVRICCGVDCSCVLVDVFA